MFGEDELHCADEVWQARVTLQHDEDWRRIRVIGIAALGDVDYSIVVGLPVAGLVYLALCRTLDLETERRMVNEEGVLPVAH